MRTSVPWLTAASSKKETGLCNPVSLAISRLLLLQAIERLGRRTHLHLIGISAGLRVHIAPIIVAAGQHRCFLQYGRTRPGEGRGPSAERRAGELQSRQWDASDDNAVHVLAGIVSLKDGERACRYTLDVNRRPVVDRNARSDTVPAFVH